MVSAVRNVCVYCASSQQARPAFYEAAASLGSRFAEHGVAITYGGGAVGMMGAIADAALDAGGRVIGIIPAFMQELEWGHPRVTELHITVDMHERKTRMIRDADAIVALAGGCGTLEELFEAITWKRLALHSKPIVMLNTCDFFTPVAAVLDRVIEERFMRPEHAAMWSIVDTPEEVLPAIEDAPPWGEDARKIATW